MAQRPVGLQCRPQKAAWDDRERAVRFSTVNRVEDQLAMLMGQAPQHSNTSSSIQSYDEYRKQQQQAPMHVEQPRVLPRQQFFQPQPRYPPNNELKRQSYAEPRYAQPHNTQPVYAPPPAYQQPAPVYQQPVQAPPYQPVYQQPQVIYAEQPDPNQQLQSQFQQLNVSSVQQAPVVVNASVATTTTENLKVSGDRKDRKSHSGEKKHSKTTSPSSSRQRSASASGGKSSSRHSSVHPAPSDRKVKVSSSKNRHSEVAKKEKKTTTSESDSSTLPSTASPPVISTTQTQTPAQPFALTDGTEFQFKEELIEHIHEIVFSILSEVQTFRNNLESPIPGFTTQGMAIKVVLEAKAMGHFTNILTAREKPHEIIKTEIAGTLQIVVHSISNFIKLTQQNPSKTEVMGMIMTLASNMKTFVATLHKV